MSFKKIAFLVSGGLLLLSLLFPYLWIIFTSPQYPDRSPKMFLYVHSLKGDFRDWEVMGRYIGIDVHPKVPEFDFKILVIILIALSVLLIISAFLGPGWKKIASILLIVIGLTMLGWAQYRLYLQGHNLDPTAPLRFTVKPFTPPIIGITRVSKIRIYHLPHLASLLFAASAALSVFAAWRRE